jgi:hypothetical protein
MFSVAIYKVRYRYICKVMAKKYDFRDLTPVDFFFFFLFGLKFIGLSALKWQRDWRSYSISHWFPFLTSGFPNLHISISQNNNFSIMKQFLFRCQETEGKGESKIMRLFKLQLKELIAQLKLIDFKVFSLFFVMKDVFLLFSSVFSSVFSGSKQKVRPYCNSKKKKL